MARVSVVVPVYNVEKYLRQCLDSVIKQDYKDIEIIIRDFSKAFISHSNFSSFKKSGGRMSVLNRSKLLAVCANPVSPEGYILDSERLCSRLSSAINLPVYDIRRIRNEA